MHVHDYMCAVTLGHTFCQHVRVAFLHCPPPYPMPHLGCGCIDVFRITVVAGAELEQRTSRLGSSASASTA